MSVSDQSPSETVLLPADVGATGASRRSEPRFPAFRELHVLPIHGGRDLRTLKTSLVDCSGRGLGVVLDEPLQTGQHFLIRLQLDPVVLALYRVRHCTVNAQGRYHIGAELCQLIPPQDTASSDRILYALLAAADPL